jgi:cellulose synthase/poly-beta-1,6-N-acetylglucosamine synthase-like glycosyltransferase
MSLLSRGTPDSRPLVSMLLPAWNEANHLSKCLRSILSLRYPQKQVILCAGGPDGSFDIAQRFESFGVIVLEQTSGEGKQAALRKCLAHATGEIIYLVDADCLVDDETFEGVLHPILEEDEEVVTGSWRPLHFQLGNPRVQFQWSHHKKREEGLPAFVDTLDGRNTAIRRSALQRAGGFGCTAPIGTDYILSHQLLQAGCKIRFVRQASVQTEYPESARNYLLQQSRWLRNRLVIGFLFQRWGDVVTHMRAVGVGIFMLLGPLWWLRKGWLRVIWAGIGLHLIADQIRQYLDLTRVEQLRPDHYRFLTHLFPNLVLGWLALVFGFIEALSPRRRWRW